MWNPRQALVHLALLTLLSATSARARDEHETRHVEGAVPADRPKVLLIGDSISIGYTEAVRERLEKEADVRRIPGNGQSTDFGLEHIDAWLGDEHWDVIHFNWGIWDTHIVDRARIRNAPEVYRANLHALIARLKATGAKLIWASTTPIARDIDGELGVKKANVPMYNGIAESIMQESKIPVNDLYRHALPRLRTLQTEDGVHFTNDGSAFLAKYVARSIRRELRTQHIGHEPTMGDAIGRTQSKKRRTSHGPVHDHRAPPE